MEGYMDNDNYNDYDYSELDPKKRGPIFRIFKYIFLFLAKTHGKLAVQIFDFSLLYHRPL